MSALASIEDAVAAIGRGEIVGVVDDEDRENEGDLIFAAEKATPELVAFMVRYTSGYICVPITEAEADRLDLPPMFHTNQDVRGTAYTVTVYAVPRRSWLTRNIGGRSSRSASASVTATQM